MTILEQYLANIGKTTAFLNPKLDEDFGSSLTGIKEGVELIKKHI